MNRVTRISSAAFGMLLLAGLAVYQGDEGTIAVGEGALVGTAVRESAKKPRLDCEKTSGLSEKDRLNCTRKENPDHKDQR